VTRPIGVLALQGDFALHARALERLGVPAVEIRKPGELAEVAGLIMPGGESTTLLKLMDAWDFFPALEKLHAAGTPIFGTCRDSSSSRATSRARRSATRLHRHHRRAQCLRPPEGVVRD
jgi:glutamine amidotransferase PdxT